jgi:hypothetical protein
MFYLEHKLVSFLLYVCVVIVNHMGTSVQATAAAAATSSSSAVKYLSIAQMMAEKLAKYLLTDNLLAYDMSIQAKANLLCC